MKLAAIVALASFFGLAALRQQNVYQREGVASGPQVRSAVEARIREAWQDFKEKKEDAYAALLDDDYTGVEIDGKAAHDKKASVSEVTAGTLDRYSLSSIKITPLGADSALATYMANTDGTMPDGKQVHGTVAVTEVWVRRAGKWKALRYHESELRSARSLRDVLCVEPASIAVCCSYAAIRTSANGPALVCLMQPVYPGVGLLVAPGAKGPVAEPRTTFCTSRHKLSRSVGLRFLRPSRSGMTYMAPTISRGACTRPRHRNRRCRLRACTCKYPCP